MRERDRERNKKIEKGRERQKDMEREPWRMFVCVWSKTCCAKH